MESISTHLARDHGYCEGLFQEVEQCVAQRDWNEAAQRMSRFSKAMERHIAMEELVLFPAFERILGQSRYPIAMLRTEHRQLELLIRRTRESVEGAALADFALHAETFVLLHGQHSDKEDTVLYPVLDQLLHAERASILEAMQAIRHPPALAAAPDSCNALNE